MIAADDANLAKSSEMHFVLALNFISLQYLMALGCSSLNLKIMVLS